MKNYATILITTAIFSICLLIAFSLLYIQFSIPKRSGELKTKGLYEKVNIYFDNYGRAHVYANNVHDLLFTQGYLIAQDRLFQIDIARRAAKGELSEIIGKSGLIRDTFVRNIGLINSARAELKTIKNKETLNILKYYSEGITAYIEKHKHNLPIEFRVLNYKPKPWKPIDSIILTKQLAEIIDTSWQLDLIRKEIYDKIPLEKANELFEQSFPANPVINYDAKKYLVFDEYILKKPNLIQKWKSLKEKVALKKIITAPYFKIKKKIIEAADFLRNGVDRWEGFNWGSNCWVTGTQKYKEIILANDPHMELANPSFWYPVHLVDKKNKLSVLGLSIPGIPGILIGHNETIAWGITSLSADVQDIFIGEFKDKNSLLYKQGNKWVKAKVIKSKIKIKNQKAPYIHETILTSCGPVLDRDGKTALSVKWSTTEAKNVDSVGSIWNLGKAKSWQTFRSALSLYSGPTLSFHYADIHGNIGYQAAGVIPNRIEDTGNIPISGFDSSKYWAGYIPFEKLPNAYNPQVGYIVSANNKVVNSSYPYDLGNNFLSPFRAGRISTILANNTSANLEQHLSFQQDLYSWVTHYLTIQILEAFYNSKINNRDLLAAIQLLNKWDFNLTSDSSQALIIEKTHENLFKKILENKLGYKLAKEYLKEWRANSLSLIRILINEDKFWLPSGVKNYQALLILSFSDAVNEIKSFTMSTNPINWRWGKYHSLTLEHLFSKAFPLLGPLVNVGPIQLGGNRDTISACGTNNNLKVFWGPSAKIVINLKNLNNAHIQLPLGVSAQIGSPYYKDQTKGWIENNGEPFVYDENIITTKAKETLTLNPM